MKTYYLTFEIASLFNWFAKKGSEIFVHECSRDELSTHGDEAVRNNMLTKLKSYNILPVFAHQPDYYFDAVTSQYAKDQNGIIDNIKKCGKWELVREQYLRIKNRYLSANDQDHPSFVCYAEAVNNVYNSRNCW